MKINPFGGQTTPKQEPIHYINNRGGRYNSTNNQYSQRDRGSFRGRPYQRGSQNTRGQDRTSITGSSKQCYKCGNRYNQNHLQSCPAKDNICSKCAKRGQFAKVCRSTNVNYLTRQYEQQEEIETESIEKENDPVAFAKFISSNGWDEYQIDNISVMAIAESFEIKITNLLSENDLYGHRQNNYLLSPNQEAQCHF